MAGSSINWDAYAAILDGGYNQALNANVSNFVKVQLSGRENHEIWRAQMMCLLDVYNMRWLMNDHTWYTSRNPMIAKQYDNLLKGWVISSIDQHVLKRIFIRDSDSASYLFHKLKLEYGQHGAYEFSLLEGAPFLDEEQMLMDVSQNDNESAKVMIELLNAIMEENWWKAKAILKNHKDASTKVINKNGDTILHLAVRAGKNYFVKQLLNFIEDGSKIKIKNKRGHTALHSAVIVDNKQAAELLVNKSNELLYVSDDESSIPSVFAYYAGQINTFLYLHGVTTKGARRDFVNSSFDNDHFFVCNLLAEAASAKQYNLALKFLKIPGTLALATKDDKALLALTANFPPELGFWEALICPSSDGVSQNIVKRGSLLLYSFENLYKKAHAILWPIINLKNTYLRWLLLFIVIILLAPIAVFYLTYLLLRIIIFVLLLPLFMLYPHLWKGLVYAGLPIKHIEKKKIDYGEAIEVLKLICKEINKTVSLDNYTKFYKEPILEAARVDACEVVVEILCGFEDAQKCLDERGHNIFKIAISNRSEKVYTRLFPGMKQNKLSLDSEFLHFAAKLASSIVLSLTTGAALQLQQEIQWHEDVKKLMSTNELTKKNVDGETSDMVFTREHADLLKEGEQWIKTTAESCSITAALIVTIVFAAAITVPGGSNQETGIPLFKKDIAFTIFAVCDALSLFTAATALLVFLSILTTRFSEKDFLVSLPRRLILGLSALFISTTTMMVAFGAILFLVFCDQRPWMLAPIGLFACLPISVIVTLQLPLLLDVFQSTYISRFDKKKVH